MGRLSQEFEVFPLLGTSASSLLLFLQQIFHPPDEVRLLGLTGLNPERFGTLFRCPILPRKLEFHPFQASCDQDSANRASMRPFSTKDACQKGSVRGFFPPSDVGP